MKYRIIGIFIIGISITLLIAITFLFLSDPIRQCGWKYNYVITAKDFFLYSLFLGIPITSMIALWNHKKLLKDIVYPISIGLIMGILLGILFPSNYSFNKTILLAILTLGFFISLISIGRYFLKK